MNPALNCGPGGPGIDFSGTWLNKKTNKTVNIRGNYFDGDRMFVMTTTGEQIDGVDFTNNFIQVGGTEKEIQETLSQITKTADPDPMFEGLEELAKENKRTQEPVREMKLNVTEPVEENDLNKVIKQIFKKTPLTYEVKLNLSEWPKEALNMAMEYLDVDISDIVKYVEKNIKINRDSITREIVEFLAS